LSATIRRYVVRNVTLDDLVARNSLSHQAAAFLHLLMQLRSRVTVSGEPGAGKTTLLAALLAAAPAHHCVRACAEIRELAVPITHGSYYEVRPPALDGTGEIALRDLVKFVLTIPALHHQGEYRGRHDRRGDLRPHLAGPERRRTRREAAARGLRSARSSAR